MTASFRKSADYYGEVSAVGPRPVEVSESFRGFTALLRLPAIINRDIQAATIRPAEFMGKLDQYGSIEPGKAADLLILDKNP